MKKLIYWNLVRWTVNSWSRPSLYRQLWWSFLTERSPSLQMWWWGATEAHKNVIKSFVVCTAHKSVTSYLSAGWELVAVDECDDHCYLVIFVRDVWAPARKQVLQAVERTVVVGSVTVAGAELEPFSVLDSLTWNKRKKYRIITREIKRYDILAYWQGCQDHLSSH